jgi:hypothetical protein
MRWEGVWQQRFLWAAAFVLSLLWSSHCWATVECSYSIGLFPANEEAAFPAVQGRRTTDGVWVSLTINAPVGTSSPAPVGYDAFRLSWGGGGLLAGYYTFTTGCGGHTREKRVDWPNRSGGSAAWNKSFTLLCKGSECDCEVFADEDYDCDGIHDNCDPDFENCDNGKIECDLCTNDNSNEVCDCPNVDPATGECCEMEDPCDDPDDLDCDGIPNDEDDDIDGDGIPNWEDPDIDGDGIINEEDEDDDGDGINDDEDDSPCGNQSAGGGLFSPVDPCFCAPTSPACEDPECDPATECCEGEPGYPDCEECNPETDCCFGEPGYPLCEECDPMLDCCPEEEGYPECCDPEIECCPEEEGYPDCPEDDCEECVCEKLDSILGTLNNIESGLDNGGTGYTPVKPPITPVPEGNPPDNLTFAEQLAGMGKPTRRPSYDSGARRRRRGSHAVVRRSAS